MNPSVLIYSTDPYCSNLCIVYGATSLKFLFNHITLRSLPFSTSARFLDHSHRVRSP